MFNLLIKNRVQSQKIYGFDMSFRCFVAYFRCWGVVIFPGPFFLEPFFQDGS